MIRRISDSVEISYRFHGLDGGELIDPALYSLCVNTGRDSLVSRKDPVPDAAPITELIEAYRHEYEAYRQEERKQDEQLMLGKGADRSKATKHLGRCADLRPSIERELLNYLGRPEFMKYSYKARYYAVLNDSVWSCTRDLAEDQWRALIGRALAREEAKLTAYINNQSPKIAKREFIPESVRMTVWRRDEGKCVRCGSNERLEFDHIIPVALGGSSTARNIQLLCEPCNRAKSASIV